MKQDNKKLIAYIVFALLAVVLCYLFIVVYFYYINPYDISLKLAFWPFQSNKSMAELYMDSVVEVEYNVKGEFDDSETVYLTGVNVRKDGFVVCPYHSLSSMQDTSLLSVKDNKGNVYNGKLLYFEQNLDLAIIKCLDIQNEKAEVKIPFVKFADIAQEDFLVVNSPLTDGAKYEKASLVDFCYAAFLTEKDNFLAVDYVWECCTAITYSENIQDGIVFNKDAQVVGFSCASEFNLDSQSVNAFLPIINVSLFFDNVVEKYYNNLEHDVPLVDLFVGMDKIELEYNYDLSLNLQEEDYNNNTDHFLYRGQWKPYTEDILDFVQGETDGFFLLEPFVYNDVQIDANKRIDYVFVNDKEFIIFSRLDLMQAIYNIESGDNVKICFGDNLSNDTQQIQFTFLGEL